MHITRGLADRTYICFSGSNLFAFAKAGLRYVIVEPVFGLVVTADMLLCHEKNSDILEKISDFFYLENQSSARQVIKQKKKKNILGNKTLLSCLFVI